jgi:hypothetical protein
MRPSLPRLGVLVAAALAVACGGGSSSPPIPPLTWTWQAIAGSVCADGSPTGIGIEAPATPTDKVLVFLDGGGACWDYTTCFLAHTASTFGPFGGNEMQTKIRDKRAGSVLDRSAPGNPYKDFTFVFVPYCTADVHSGDTTQAYGSPTTLHHNGRVNLSNAFQYLATVITSPSKVVVSGSSAGGFGSLLAFTKAKAAWPGAKAYLVDDSGPPLANIPTTTVAAWTLAWHLDAAVAEACGSPCDGALPTLAPIIPTLATRYPADRFALLSSLQDQTIRYFFMDWTDSNQLLNGGMPAGDFETALRQLAASIEDSTPPGETHAFLVTGSTHPMLDKPGNFTSENVTLFEFLRRQVEDDPAWSAEIPP